MLHLIPVLAVLALITARLLYNVFRPGLTDIPGPFICKISNAYRTYRAWKGDSQVWYQELREEYGTLVRIGPNVVLDSEHGEFQKIFSFKDDYIKSSGMDVWKPVVNGKVYEALASATTPGVHGKLKRPIAQLYSNTNVVAYQPRVTETIKYFIKRLDEEFIQGKNAGRRCDIDHWVQYFAFDIVGQLTLSRRLGFLESGSDVSGMLHELEMEFDYRGTVQNMPILDRFMRKNPLYLYFRAPTSFFASNAKRLVGERLSDEKHAGVDMLDGFLEAQKKHPQVVDQRVLMSYISTNFLAGSDTTGVTMRSMIWYVLRTPGVLEKLREELDAKVDSYPPDYATAMDLKYMDAVIREALRIHPIGSIVFERVVPATGHTTPSGKSLPPGTTIGSTPWTINFDEDLWGPEPRKFRPERWLQGKDESAVDYEKRLNMMKHNDFSFSYGPRACLGKHIAWMEMVEVMPTLFGLLDMEFADKNKDWNVHGAFFTKQSNMDVTMKWRKGVDKSQILDN